MRVAAVDIGTNTVRLLIAEVVGSGSAATLGELERHEVITKLGEGLDTSGRLGDAPMGRALGGLRYFAGLIDGTDVVAKAGVATAATRSAANGAEFADRVADVLGFRPLVIDGVEEARLTFNGATRALEAKGSFCVIDVGGGSTEFVVGEHHPDYAMSVDIGSVRLTERVTALGLRNPEETRDYVDGLFDHVVPPYQASHVLGSGGTFTTMAAVHFGIETSELEVRTDVVVSLAALRETADRLQGMSQVEIAALPGVAPGRAGVLQAGSICAERAVAHIGVTQVGISVSDILDGLALELALA